MHLDIEADLDTQEKLALAQQHIEVFERTCELLGAKVVYSNDKRRQPKELRTQKVLVTDGFLCVVIFKDRKGKEVRCWATQSGRTWPWVPEMQHRRRLDSNRWAARRFAEIYQDFNYKTRT